MADICINITQVQYCIIMYIFSFRCYKIVIFSFIIVIAD